jgi:hypothetical protein
VRPPGVGVVREMKVGPSSRPWGEAPNHHMLCWLKTVVVSDVEKAPVGCQVGTRKMSEPEPLLTCRYVPKGIETVAMLRAAGAGPGGCPMTGQVVSGTEAA